MADEVAVALRLPKVLHARIHELAPARGASAWMVRALAHVAANPEILEHRTTPELDRREVTPHWKHTMK